MPEEIFGCFDWGRGPSGQKPVLFLNILLCTGNCLTINTCPATDINTAVVESQSLWKNAEDSWRSPMVLQRVRNVKDFGRTLIIESSTRAYGQSLHYFSTFLKVFINKKGNNKITDVGNLMGQGDLPSIHCGKGLPEFRRLGGAEAHESLAQCVTQMGRFWGPRECHRAQCTEMQCTAGVGLCTTGEN